MGTGLALLLAVPFVGWLAALVVGTHRRERRRLRDLQAGAELNGWTWTTDAAEIRPHPPRLREWRRRLRFQEGFSGYHDDLWFGVAHVVHEVADAATEGRRVHATICWVQLPFPVEEVRIVPVELVEELRGLVDADEFRTGDTDFDARYRILAADELLGRRAAGPVARSLLLAYRTPWRITVQGITVVAERVDRVPRTVEDALNGVAVAAAVARGLTGSGRR